MDRVKEVLRRSGIAGTDTEARLIVEAASARTRVDLALDPTIDEGDAQRALELARRRASGEPLQYVTGIAGFRRLELAVGPGVFVPRPETELVVDKAMDRLPRGGKLVDVGTGSGAIALAVADERPDARVVATERSPAALEWVQRNRTMLHKDVEIIECDLLEGLPADLRAKVDVVVSNPPYVAESERGRLPVDIVDHEPEVALFGGRLGTDLIERIADQARAWLRPGGWLVLEMGAGQRNEVSALLERLGFEDVAVGVDFADWPRVVEARRP